jgi:MoaA/NifB/PqqE/SkfB family radical SAM enzyme
MQIEQLLLVLPTDTQDPSEAGMGVHQWTALLEQFAAQGGREVLLGGAEPLRYPGFWALVRKAAKAGVPRVSAFLSGDLLEPWVVKGLAESGVHLLVSVDSLQPSLHDALHGTGSHSRAMAAVDTFLNLRLAPRVGILASITRQTLSELPVLAAWAAGRRLSRLLWTFVPEGGWPSKQLQDWALSPAEAVAVAENLHGLARSLADTTYIAPVDDPALPMGFSPLLRVTARGDASWGFGGLGGYLGNLRFRTLGDLLQHSTQAAGD